MKNLKAIIYAAVAIVLPVSNAHAQAVDVTPANPGSWAVHILGSARGGFEAGPGAGAPPTGVGSAYQELDNADAYVGFRSTAYEGVKLSAFTNLRYSTYVTLNQSCQAAALTLRLDNNNDGVGDDTLRFEPCYQSGSYAMRDGAAPVPDQCTGPDGTCFPLSQWVDWNALAGGWWADSDGVTGPPLDTIATYLADHQDATVVNINTTYFAQIQQPINSANTSNWPARSRGGIPIMFKLSSGALGGIRLAAGNGWQSFDGNFDSVTIGVNGANTTYNFDGVGSGPVAGALVPTCNLPAATLEVTRIGSGPDEPVNESSINAADSGNEFRVVDCKYQYILAIRSLPGAGKYKVEIKISGSTVGTAQFDLR